MRKAFAGILVLAVFILRSASQASGGSWDDGFHTAFMNHVGNNLGAEEAVTCVATLGTEVYIGSGDTVNHFGRVWRYKETDGIWQELAVVYGFWGVRALNAAEDGNGIKYLFVGGGFSSVICLTNQFDARNVFCLNLCSGQSWRLGTPPNDGTDGPVFGLKALPWTTSYQGGTVKVVVGGEFNTAGSGSLKGLALWKQSPLLGGVVSPAALTTMVLPPEPRQKCTQLTQ